MDTTTVVEKTIHKQIEDDRKDALPVDSSWEDLKKYRAYYRGRQAKTLNADQIRIMQGVIGNRFSHNICKKIVNEKANRLDIARYDVDDVAVREFLYDTWVKNQVPDLFAEVMVATLRDGNSYIGLNWVPTDDPGDPYGGRVTLGLERSWDGDTGVYIHYGPDRRPLYAVKEWTVDKLRFRTIYYDDHFLRFMQVGEGWEPYNLPSDPIPVDGPFIPGWVDWKKIDGSGIGIPFVHIPNGSDDDSNYGTSELDGGVLGFQDQINAIQHDITSVSLLTGSPRTTSSGFTLGEDPATGEKIRPKTGPGAHWHVDEESAKWGVIESGDIQPLKDALMVKVEAVCYMTETPLHAITGQWPSGEALFRAEMPLVQAVEKLSKKVGPAMASVAHRATEIQNAFGRMFLDESKLITAVFFNVDKRDPLTRALYVERVAPFVSQKEVLRLLDYAPGKIEEILKEKDEEAAAAVERQQAMFAAGAVVPTLPKNDNPIADRNASGNEDDEE